jgi:RNA polymerase sigma-70 factor (ECF subfamily)
MPEADTREVVERLLQGKARLIAFLKGHLGHRADAEDVLQQALLILVEKRESLRRGESIVAWFHTVLRNLVVDALRRRQARVKLAARLTKEVPAAMSDDTALFAEVCACVREIMTTLRPGYAEMLKLVDLDDEPVDSAAKRLGITAGNASVRLYRARRALLEGLRRVCGACLEHGCLDCACRGARSARGGGCAESERA